MAEKLESFDFRGRGGNHNPTYPWSEWEHGVWKATYGEDFQINIKSFTGALHGHARKRPGMHVRTSVVEHCVIFEFYYEEPK
jgi:hypothetical protein